VTRARAQWRFLGDLDAVALLDAADEGNPEVAFLRFLPRHRTLVVGLKGGAYGGFRWTPGSGKASLRTRAMSRALSVPLREADGSTSSLSPKNAAGSGTLPAPPAAAGPRTPSPVPPPHQPARRASTGSDTSLAAPASQPASEPKSPSHAPGPAKPPATPPTAAAAGAAHATPATAAASPSPAPEPPAPSGSGGKPASPPPAAVAEPAAPAAPERREGSKDQGSVLPSLGWISFSHPLCLFFCR
jgi:hypothetical protein